METKVFTVIDRATRISVIGTLIGLIDKTERAEIDVLTWAGYEMITNPKDALVLLTDLSGGRKAHFNPYSWNDRTFSTAHQYIAEHWNELKSGDEVNVIDILGERIPLQTPQTPHNPRDYSDEIVEIVIVIEEDLQKEELEEMITDSER